MKCQRCGGTLAAHQAIDFGVVGRGTRCINCGDIKLDVCIQETRVDVGRHNRRVEKALRES